MKVLEDLNRLRRTSWGLIQINSPASEEHSVAPIIACRYTSMVNVLQRPQVVPRNVW